MPLLLVLFPDKSAATLTSITMTVVFFNAVSGSVQSSRQHRIRYRTGLVYAAASLPAVVAGILVQAVLTRQTFTAVFGGFLALSSLLLLFKPAAAPGQQETGSRVRFWAGAGVSLVIGFLSSFFGVGGGFLFVPLFVFGLHLSTREATATSQFILGFSSLLVIGAAVVHGQYSLEPFLLSLLVLGVVLGSWLGGLLAERMPGTLPLRVLAVLLIAVGLKLVFF